MDAGHAARNALLNVLDAAPGERIVVVCDDTHEDVGRAFAKGALDLSLWTRLVILDTSTVRKEIPIFLQEIFASQKPDIFINLLSGGSEETPFRIKVIKMETRRRIRLGHCPGVSHDMLTSGALALESDEYKRMQIFSNNLILKLTNSVKVSVNLNGLLITENSNDQRVESSRLLRNRLEVIQPVSASSSGSFLTPNTKNAIVIINSSREKTTLNRSSPE